MGDYSKLEVWKLAKDLAVKVYQHTNEGTLAKDFDLRNQIRRAAVSIPSNIAEGDESGSAQNSIRYFNIAKGSSAELRTQLLIAFEIGYLSKERYDELNEKYCEISQKLEKLIQARQKRITSSHKP